MKNIYGKICCCIVILAYLGNVNDVAFASDLAIGRVQEVKEDLTDIDQNSLIKEVDSNDNSYVSDGRDNTASEEPSNDNSYVSDGRDNTASEEPSNDNRYVSDERDNTASEEPSNDNSYVSDGKDTTDLEEPSLEDYEQKKTITTGIWEMAKYNFDTETKVLTVFDGLISRYGPWTKSESGVSDVKQIVFAGKVKAPKDFTGTFEDMRSLIKFSNSYNLDTSDVVDMTGLFRGCERLNELDLNLWDVSNVTNMNRLFEGMTNLSTLRVGGWDTSSVETMNSIFRQASKLTELDLSRWDTRNISTMNMAFYDAIGLKELDISGWDTGNVTNMSNLFGFYATPLSLSKIKLGPNFRFMNNAGLPSPKISNSGKWTSEDGTSENYSPKEFMEKYGTGDLTAGTYVGDWSDHLITTIGFENQVGVVGQSLSANLIIKRVDDPRKPLDIENIKVNIDLFLNETFDEQNTFEFSKVILERYNLANQLQDTIRLPSVEKIIDLPVLQVGNYYKLKIDGEIWNTSRSVDSKNYQIDIEYTNKGSDNKEIKTISEVGTYLIQSGNFGFSQIPAKLEFEQSILPQTMSNIIIGRIDPTWGIDIEDYRGTIGDPNEEIDRKNWDIVAYATPFEILNGSGKPISTVSPDKLSIIYKKDGKIFSLSEGNEILIESHNVFGEIPKHNHEKKLIWSKDEGFLVRAQGLSGIKTDEKYESTLVLDLRNAP